MSDTSNVYAASNQLGEAAIWHVASRRLLWIDLYVPRLFSHDPASGQTRVMDVNLPKPLGAIVATTNPRLVMVSHLGGLSTFDIETGATAFFANPERGRDAVIYNDCKCDRFGRLWVGSSHFKEQDARGALWCVLPGGEAYLADVGFVVSNGPSFSLDGRTMFFNDSVGRRTFAYDLSKDDPHARNRRVLMTYGDDEGVPDGTIVDSEDHVWIAHWGGARVTRMTQKGDRLQTLAVPALHVTTMAFGGDDLRTLYITSAREGLSSDMLAKWPQSGDLFKCVPGATGVPEPLFKLD
jgi:xylono-1,5-lactonase